MTDTTQWANRILKYDVKPADQFTANPKNPRRHPQEQRQAVGGSLNALGWVSPVIENQRTGYLIDGHERIWQALQTNAPVPYILVDLSEEEEALALATLDFTTYMAQYERQALDDLLAEINVDNPDLQAMLASMPDVLADMFVELEPSPDDYAKAPEAKMDQAEELLRIWGVETGQIWVVPSPHGGEHRVMCGDATIKDDVERLIAGLITPLMVTDPPYGVTYNQEWRSSNRVGEVTNDDQASWLAAWRLSPAEVAYVWHASRHMVTVFNDLERAGFEHRAQIIWNKSRHVFSQGHYHWKHEPCFYAVRKGKTANWAGDRKQNTVWDIAADADAPGNHSTQKPVECMARPIRNHLGHVYDPFGGSGTTLVAAELLGRQARVMEIAPKYVAVILQRAKDMGLEPRLDMQEAA